MKALDFNDRWVKLVLFCISTVKYSVMLNGKPEKSFSPSRRLRKGDPLSPYIFLMCAKGLSCMINNAEKNGEIQGLAITRGGN